MDNNYKNLIFTNHALNRIYEREIKKETAYEAFKNFDKKNNKKDGKTEFIKKIDKHIITLVAKKNEKNEWIVLSAWMDPPLAGTRDAKRKEEYKRYQKAGFWKKMLLTVKRQIFN